jgi:C4-dicarboxylate-specific signal transduction histidine kinase
MAAQIAAAGPALTIVASLVVASTTAVVAIAAGSGAETPSLWDHYRGEIITVGAIVVLQTVLIVILLFERHRRSGAEAEARRRHLEVAHLNRAGIVSALSASITHEINQPLGAILSNAEAAEELVRSGRLDAGELAAILADIRRDDQRAADIICGMRGLLRRGDLLPREFDLTDCVRDVLVIIGPEVRSRHVTLTTEQETGALPVTADPVHLQQVILNLALNAMDAMQGRAPDARTLEIRTARVGNTEVVLTVADTGTGIPDDELGTIFEPFFTTKEHGTGLGLSIARTIVTTYSGHIWAENRSGGGAMVHFTLPLAARKAQSKP